MAVRMAMTAAAVAMALATMPTEARGHHGFHGHRGGGFGFHHARMHCRNVKDQNGVRKRICT